MADEGQTPGGEPGDGGNPLVETKPPVSEEINWRSRALEAESRLADVERSLAELRAALDQSRAALEQNQRRRAIDLAASAAGAIDVDAAAILIEAALQGRPADELTGVVEDMRRSRPFLFEHAPPPASVMSAEPSRGGETLATLADEARASGDRKALLRYLQARRSAQ